MRTCWTPNADPTWGILLQHALSSNDGKTRTLSVSQEPRKSGEVFRERKDKRDPKPNLVPERCIETGSSHCPDRN